MLRQLPSPSTKNATVALIIAHQLTERWATVLYQAARLSGLAESCAHSCNPKTTCSRYHLHVNCSEIYIQKSKKQLKCNSRITESPREKVRETNLRTPSHCLH